MRIIPWTGTDRIDHGRNPGSWRFQAPRNTDIPRLRSRKIFDARYAPAQPDTPGMAVIGQGVLEIHGPAAPVAARHRVMPLPPHSDLHPAPEGILPGGGRLHGNTFTESVGCRDVPGRPSSAGPVPENVP